LDEISLQDILPSIRKHGQQKPGTVRPIDGGRFELIEGSRRLAAVKLAKREYLALVGDVPDADIRELGVIENKHKDVSPYEKAKAYLRQIENGEYENWTQLGAAKGISPPHISRYRACAELEEVYVRLLPSPSDMTLSYGETIARLIKKDGEGLASKAEELCKLRQASVLEKQELPNAEEALKILKSAVRTKAEVPKAKKPVIYKSKDGARTVKHSITNQGTTKLELAGLSQEEVSRVIEHIQGMLKMKN
jgi:ParB family transcriptional regulator, chromosome partitioning protein